MTRDSLDDVLFLVVPLSLQNLIYLISCTIGKDYMSQLFLARKRSYKNNSIGVNIINRKFIVTMLERLCSRKQIYRIFLHTNY